MKKNVLIIGFGSIGRKHAKILNSFKEISNIYILSKQKSKKFKFIKNYNEAKKLKLDYIIISSRTSEHLKHLNFIEKNFKRKTILVEKPLFENLKKFKPKYNKVIVGYNLRYHPVLKFIREYIVKKKILSIYIYCQSYLPDWRKKINYKDSNSAKKIYGGGALLELSHELDYLQWILRSNLKINYALINKNSSLKVDVEDNAILVGKINKTVFSINLNFYSFLPRRKIIINGKNFSLEADLFKNDIIINEPNSKKIRKFKIDNLYTYKMQHKHLLRNKSSISCTYNEGNKILSIIDKIKMSKKHV